MEADGSTYPLEESVTYSRLGSIANMNHTIWKNSSIQTVTHRMQKYWKFSNSGQQVTSEYKWSSQMIHHTVFERCSCRSMMMILLEFTMQCTMSFSKEPYHEHGTVSPCISAFRAIYCAPWLTLVKDLHSIDEQTGWSQLNSLIMMLGYLINRYTYTPKMHTLHDGSSRGNDDARNIAPNWQQIQVVLLMWGNVPHFTQYNLCHSVNA